MTFSAATKLLLVNGAVTSLAGGVAGTTASYMTVVVLTTILLWLIFEGCSLFFTCPRRWLIERLLVKDSHLADDESSPNATWGAETLTDEEAEVVARAVLKAKPVAPYEISSWEPSKLMTWGVTPAELRGVRAELRPLVRREAGNWVGRSRAYWIFALLLIVLALAILFLVPGRGGALFIALMIVGVLVRSIATRSTVQKIVSAIKRVENNITRAD